MERTGMLLRYSSFSFNKAAETTAQASPIFAWKVTSPVFECLKPLAAPEPCGSFSTSKQPHNVPQSFLNLFLNDFIPLHADANGTGRFFGNLSDDLAPQSSFITLCLSNIWQNSRGGGNSTQALKGSPRAHPGIKVSVFLIFTRYIDSIAAYMR